MSGDTDAVREYALLPRRIDWRGPDGSTVVLDEDGVSVQVPSRLEQADLERLLEIIAVAKEARAAGLTFVPRPTPTAPRSRSNHGQAAVLRAVRDVRAHP